MAISNLALTDVRREERDEVHYRTTATCPQGRPLPLVVVNSSPGGMMARCDATLAPGDTVTVRLPDLAPLTAKVRWALGGRIGCEFAAPIPPARYFAILPRLRG